MAMKLTKKSLINRSCGITSNPANVISTLEKASLVTSTEADRVNGNFEYYKQNPWNGN